MSSEKTNSAIYFIISYDFLMAQTSESQAFLPNSGATSTPSGGNALYAQPSWEEAWGPLDASVPPS